MLDPMWQFIRDLKLKLRYDFYAARQGLPKSEDLSYAVVDHPLILISEIQRSGGTFLSQLMDGHREIFAYPSEFEIGYPLKWHWLANIPDRNDFFMFERLCDRPILKLAREGAYKKGPLTGPLQEMTFDFDFDLRRYKRVLKDMLAKEGGIVTQRLAFIACMTAFFNAWRNYHHGNPVAWQAKKFVSGFVPRLIMFDASVASLFESCPRAKILTVIRGPASWYASAKAHGYDDIDAAMKLWACSAAASMRLAEERPHAVMQLFFDEIVLDNEGVMRRVADFCDLSWDESLLVPTFNGIAIPSNSRFESKIGVDTNVVDRGLKYLSEDEKSFITRFVHNETAFGDDGRLRPVA